jgi:hypothetical protein
MKQKETVKPENGQNKNAAAVAATLLLKERLFQS